MNIGIDLEWSNDNSWFVRIGKKIITDWHLNMPFSSKEEAEKAKREIKQALKIMKIVVDAANTAKECGCEKCVVSCQIIEESRK